MKQPDKIETLIDAMSRVKHSDEAEAARQRMMRDNANAWKTVRRKGRAF